MSDPDSTQRLGPRRDPRAQSDVASSVVRPNTNVAPDVLSRNADVASSISSRHRLGPRFDAHIHVWEAPWENFIVGTSRLGRFSQRDLVLALMDRHGVERACVIGARNELNTGNNEFVAELCRERPDRFVMLAEVPLSSPQREELLEKTLREWPALGFRCLAGPAENPDVWAGSDYDRFWERANAAGLLVSLNLSAKQAARLSPLVERCQNIRWLLDHMGRPRFDMADSEYQGALGLARFRNVFVKLSGFYAFTRSRCEYPYLDLARFVRGLRAAFGPDRLLWGSDAPPVLDFSSYEQTFSCLFRPEMGLTDDDLEWVFGKTAAAVFLRQKGQRDNIARFQIA